MNVSDRVTPVFGVSGAQLVRGILVQGLPDYVFVVLASRHTALQVGRGLHRRPYIPEYRECQGRSRDNAALLTDGEARPQPRLSVAVHRDRRERVALGP